MISEANDIEVEARVEHIPGQLTFDLTRDQSEKHRFRDFVRSKACRYLGGLALTAGSFFVGGAVTGVFLTDTETTIGTNRADVNLNTGNQLVMDFGPADEIVCPSPTFVGATARIKGFDPELLENGASFPSANLEVLAGLWGDKEKIAATVREDLTNQAVDTGLLVAAIGSLAYSAIYLGAGPNLRHDSYQRLKYLGGRKGIGLGVGATCMLFLPGSTVLPSDKSQIKADPVLADTLLENCSVSNTDLRDLALSAATFMTQNRNYARSILKNLEKADKHTPILAADKDSYTIVAATSTRCNMITPPVLGEIIDKSKAAYFVTTGGVTFSGTNLENSCVSTLAFHTRKANNRIAAPSNHAGSKTANILKKENFTVPEGEVVKVGGRTFLGDRSPRRSVIGTKVYQELDETESEMGERLKEQACKEKEPLFALIVDEPNAAKPTAESGCAKLVITAGAETKVAVITDIFGGKSWYAVLGSSSGGSPNTITVGPYQDVAEITVFKLSKATNDVEAVQTIKSYPSKKVIIPTPQLYSDGFGFALASQ